MSTTIHACTAADLPKLLPLFMAYLDFYRVGQDPDACIRFLNARLSRGEAQIWLARAPERELGFALLYPGFNSLTLRPQFLLHDLYVAGAARGAGVGLALLRTCQQYAAERNGDLMLETAHDNATAQRLYRAASFVKDEEFAVFRWERPAQA